MLGLAGYYRWKEVEFNDINAWINFDNYYFWIFKTCISMKARKSNHYMLVIVDHNIRKNAMILLNRVQKACFMIKYTSDNLLLMEESKTPFELRQVFAGIC